MMSTLARPLWIVLAICVFVCAADGTPPQLTVQAVDSGLPRAPRSGPVQATLLGATAGVQGLVISLQLTDVGFLGAEIYKQNKSTGGFVSFIDGTFIPVPSDYRNTSTSVGGQVTFPVLVPDQTAVYRVRLMAKTADDPKENYIFSNPILFSGYDPNPLKPPLIPLALQFASDKLTISAKTDNKVKLTAGWQLQSAAAPIGVQVTQTVQNPSVDLLYSSLSSSSQFPAIDLALDDEQGVQIEHAKLAFTVKVDQATSAKVNSVKNEPVSSNKSSSTKFSWGDLAKTGVAALLKFFAAGL